jgi:hypothetical protein
MPDNATPAIGARRNSHLYEEWRTLAVTALPPGWVNVFRDDDGKLFAYATPAMLLQEIVREVRSWEEHVGDGNWRYQESVTDCENVSTRHTRVIIGSFDAGMGEVVAEDANCRDYVGSMTAAEFEAMQAEADTATQR